MTLSWGFGQLFECKPAGDVVAKGTNHPRTVSLEVEGQGGPRSVLLRLTLGTFIWGTQLRRGWLGAW